jgi:hypothetical protein
MKRFYSFLVALLMCAGLFAQYVVSDKYDLWFEDSGHEVTTRKAVSCTENYQDLWNGCFVKISGRTIYIYRGSSSILYGEEINLLYNGYYRVKRSGTWYIADENGDLVDGIYAKTIYYFPFGYVTLQRSSGYWDIYHCSGRKVECYSYESPYMFWNGCFLIKQGRYWYVVNDDGDKIDGVYGDEVQLLNDGRWKCVRGSYVTYID